MTTAHASCETSVTVNNSPIQDYVHLQATYNLGQIILGQ